MTKELLVPYGVAPDDRLVSPDEAVRGDTYRCPGCLVPLILHAGNVVVRHFAHHADAECVGESLAHITAKRLIAQAIHDHGAGIAGRHITLDTPCAYCQKAFPYALPRRSFTRASIEQRVDPYLCDVVAHREEEPVLAIEVLATHAVGVQKGATLSLPWVELQADAILRNPHHWRPVARRLKSIKTPCPACSEKASEIKSVVAAWSLGFDEPAHFQNTAGAQYLAALEDCWKCKQRIPVYWWAGVPFCEIEPPQPRPQTIKLRTSQAYGGQYWANTCPGCRATQGDNFIFLGSKAALFPGLPIRRTTEMRRAATNATQAFVRRLFPQ